MKCLHFLFFCGILTIPAGAFAANLYIVNQTLNTQSTQPLALVSAVPFEGQNLSTPPAEIRLAFTQAVRPDKSAIKVLDMYGMPVGDADLGSSGTELSLALPQLAPGKYTVRWRARCRCSDDTDISDSFHFTVQ